MIAVVCPTRDRVQGAIALAKSVRETATKAKVVFYIDEDQRDMYRPLVEECPESVFHYGPKIGPVASDNVLAETYREFSVYGVGIDDALFTTPGWDDYLLDQVNAFPGRIGVVSANHWENPTFVNFAYVSREWIDTVGWLAFPKLYHRCWDSVLEMLGEATNMVYAPRGKFRIEHDPSHASNMETFHPDCEKFLYFCVIDRKEIIPRLKEAMKP